MRGRISENARIAVAKEHVSADLSGEIVILNLRSGVYYSLDHVGARIWELIQAPVQVARVRDALLEEYEVEPEQCTADLLALLEHLAAEGLVEVSDETHG